MTTAIRKSRLSPAKVALIEVVSDVLDDYEGQRLSARQVYYQMIGRDLFPSTWIDVAYNRDKGLPDDAKNTVKNYQRFCALLVDARYAGLISWQAIEDRIRRPELRSEWDNIEDIVSSALSAYRLPRWRGQGRKLELWIEKDALAGIFGTVAEKWHIGLQVNRGYSSASAMKEAADRLMEAAEDGDEVIILYLGDFDPSGEDMVRDVTERLIEFGCVDLEVRKIALTMEQIKRYKLPPNPAKISDSRARAYIERWGRKSWEVDALPPREMLRIVEDSIRELVDERLMRAVIAQEDLDKERLRAAAKKIAKRKPS